MVYPIPTANMLPSINTVKNSPIEAIKKLVEEEHKVAHGGGRCYRIPL
jgi:hypothetical protein